MDAMERGERAAPLPESHGPKYQEDSLQLQVPLLKHKKRGGSKAPAVILEHGVQRHLHEPGGVPGDRAPRRQPRERLQQSNVTTWFGTSYLTPIFGAVIADTFWGNYNTILVSLALYLLGMMLITFSAFLPTTTTAALCAVGASCAATAGTWAVSSRTVAFVGLYLVAIGAGGVRSSLLPFGAEQFDDDNAADRDGKASFFSWFYLCVSFGPIISGVFLVWIQQNVSWGLGFGIATACIAVAFAAFVLATPLYKRRMPTGTPLKSLCQVLAAACRKISVRVPADAGFLYEVSDKIDSQPKIAHTSEFKFLDKAAIVTESHMEERPEAATSWKLCTVTQVEELKILLRLLPVWITSVIVSSAYAQMNTTFVQQGSAMDMTFLSVSVPAASLGSFEVVCVMVWVLLYNKLIVPALRNFSSRPDGEPSHLQRMGAGRLLMALTMAAAALVEMKRLDGAARGEEIGIAWQLPQYFLLAGGEVFCYIAQLEFFFGEAPDTMKSMCTSLALLTVALGSYMSSFIYAVVEAFTATKGRPGWISDDLNQGHLDYFFWAMAAMCTLNFVVYSAVVKNYKLKMVIS
ncbi:hypothetical protein QYE76_024590 [Lolium multiflorum]|uniref:Uncharacterized protein n=1 Tax=Lolium multiflorum TaxID=4521 RepID=A0AAD8RCE0_LOLMU|nr:hypothetical protein QYE76_024590 [Lolium multiflorum]